MLTHISYKFNCKNGGIYAIVNVVNWNFYLGSTKCFEKRKRDHEYFAKNNKHHCRHLQNAYSKYGNDKFLFVIVETLPSDMELSTVEQNYLNVHFGKTYFYNSHPLAQKSKISLLGKEKLKEIYSRKKSDEERKKISESHKKIKKEFVARKTFAYDARLLLAKNLFLQDQTPNILNFSELEKQTLLDEGRKIYNSWPRGVKNNPEKEKLRLEQRKRFKCWLVEQDLWYDKRSDSWNRKSELHKKEALEILRLNRKISY